ncbi:MAG TPA: acyl-CoA dehydrogenase family protein [Acidimicrobiales bacterium]|jgi:alkylation response protein AidB-like acyl-CoA dehydrogenase|nr:acyl-CoA dehydrogenase family protein [Acidimicrobiales bacterium]
MGEFRSTGLLAVAPDAPADEVVAAVQRWVAAEVPPAWVDAGRRGGAAAVREVRTRAQYEAWYPVFGRSGLVAATWPREYGGLDLAPKVARRVDEELRPFNLGRLNPLGLNLAAPALFAHGSEEQRRRFLPPIVRNEEVWCQLFSEPGAGSDLASLATRAQRDGEEWVIDGQKVWTTWAHLSDWAVLLARTDPDAPKRKGLTYFLINLHQPGVEVRPLRHLGGEVDFNEVFLDGARVADACRVGEVGSGWKVANATLSGERQMVSGAGSGGVDRIGGSGVGYLIRLAQKKSGQGAPGGWSDPVRRDAIMRLYCEERVREWTNLRVRGQLRAGKSPGPESSVGKVHQGELNQRIQLAATDVLGMAATAWPGELGDYGSSLPHEVRGMLRSRANTIEGGTTEVNKNILGERVLGLPREPDPYAAVPWKDVPRS